MDPTRTIVFYGYLAGKERFRRLLEGLRRFARGVGWRIEAVPPMGSVATSSPLPARVASALPPLDAAAARAALARLRPAGFVVACSIPQNIPPVEVFGGAPVVWLDSHGSLRRAGPVVRTDNAAVAEAAFRELASSMPSAYAVSPYHFRRQWSDERVAAFVALCRAAGRPCHVFAQRYSDDIAERRPRRAAWAAALPDRVAVFAVNDFEARETARAFADARRSIPRSATIVGVDGFDTIPDDEYIPNVTISSVKLDYEQLGFLSARALAAQLGSAAAEGRRSQDRRGGPRVAQRRNDPTNQRSNDKTILVGPLLVERRQSTRGRGRRAPFVLDAVEAIRREAAAGLSAAELAARFPVSRNLFERRFREAMGHSVLDEILHVRLQAVQALLSRRDVAIGAVHGRCGFGSESELRGLFKARFGVSMRQWRAQHVREAHVLLKG